MIHHYVPRLTTITTVCIGILLGTLLYQPLHSAKVATPTKVPTTVTETKDAKESQATTIPPAPPLSLDTEVKESKPERKQAVEIKKAAQISTTEKTADYKEGKEAKTEVTTAPITRNLIMLFDDGTDNSAMLSRFTAALLQKCAFILITPALWDLFCSKKLTDKEPVFSADDTIKALPYFRFAINASYKNIFFEPSEWDVYQIDVKGSLAFFYLLVPQNYKSQILGTSNSDDQKLGLNLTALKEPIQLPSTSFLSLNPYSAEYRLSNNVAKALEKALVPSKAAALNCRWNVYCSGHGGPTKKLYEIAQKIKFFQKSKTKPSAAEEKEIRDMYNESGLIANLSVPSFQALTQFFNDYVSTNFFLYSTCYAGGQHLITPFVNAMGTPASLNYTIVADALMFAPSRGGGGGGFYANKTSIYRLQYALPTIKNYLPNAWFEIDIDFKSFFADLEAFTSGKKSYEHEKASNTGQPVSSSLIQTCNYVGNFLNKDGSIRSLETIPQIRFPFTEWFQVIRLGKDIAITQITRAKVLSKNLELQLANSGKAPGFDLTATDPKQDKHIVFLQTNDINTPVFIDLKTLFVPLINTIPFLEPKGHAIITSGPGSVQETVASLEQKQGGKTKEEKAQDQLKNLLKTPNIPAIFYFNTVISQNEFYDLLSNVWFSPELETKNVNNLVFLIDTLLCRNGFSLDQGIAREPIKEELVINPAAEDDFLELHKVMIFVRLEHPTIDSLEFPMILFTYKNRNLIIQTPSKITIEPLSNAALAITTLWEIFYNYCNKPATEHYSFDTNKIIKEAYEAANKTKASATARAADIYKQAAKEIALGKEVGTLFEPLWQAGLGFTQAITLAAATLRLPTSDLTNCWGKADNLLKAVWRYNKGLNETLTIASQYIESRDTTMQQDGRTLLTLLGLHARNAFIDNKSDTEKIIAVTLLKKLVEKEQALFHAKCIVEADAKKSSETVKNAIKELSSVLVVAQAKESLKTQKQQTAFQGAQLLIKKYKAFAASDEKLAVMLERSLTQEAPSQEDLVALWNAADIMHNEPLAIACVRKLAIRIMLMPTESKQGYLRRLGSWIGSKIGLLPSRPEPAPKYPDKLRKAVDTEIQRIKAERAKIAHIAA
jgi:hypothetical protein